MFTITKVLDVSSGHPAVARLFFQVSELLKWTDLPVDERDKLLTVCRDLQDGLLTCERYLSSVVSNTQKTLRECNRTADDQTKIMEHPYILNLRPDAEHFLYEAKNFLRNAAEVVNICFQLPTGSFSQASDWFNPKDGSSRILNYMQQVALPNQQLAIKSFLNDRTWIEELIKKRNAVEHPNGHSGTLYIENITGQHRTGFIAPTWQRDKNPKGEVLSDMNVLIENMLTFAEELIVVGLERRLRFPVDIVQIPEKDRDPSCPVRFTVQLKSSLRKQL